jgi:thiol-disulfide isomerase/thioredoxin
LTDLVFPKLNGVNEGAKGLRLYTTMATWCAACKSYLPELRQLRESFDPESLGMYGLPVDETDDAKKLKDYRAEYTPPYLLLSETTQPQKVALKRLLYDVNALQGLPSTVVTDSRGRVLLSTPGLPSVSQLRALPSLP